MHEGIKYASHYPYIGMFEVVHNLAGCCVMYYMTFFYF